MHSSFHRELVCHIDPRSNANPTPGIVCQQFEVRTRILITQCTLAYLAVFALLPVTHAQHVDDDAVLSAKDVFGITVGPESLGLYSQYYVRGFSPQDAGNTRIDGLYFDQQGVMTGRLVEGNEIEVGPSALGYPFPAPTGIVDWKLRDITPMFGATAIGYSGPFGSYQASLDGHGALIPEVATAAAGIGYWRDIELPGQSSDVTAVGVSTRFALTETFAIRFFFGYRSNRNEELLPTIFTDGRSLPPHVERVYFGQSWAQGDSYSEQSGMIAKYHSEANWDIQAAIFHSTAPQRTSFSDNYVNVDSHGLGQHELIAYPGQQASSYSGEVRATHSIATTGWRQNIDVSLRSRVVSSTYGGSDVLDFGPSSIEMPIAFQRPTFAFAPVTADNIRQALVGFGYSLNWRNSLDATLGVQKAFYERVISDPTSSTVRTTDEPWLYNGSLVEHFGSPLIAFISFTRGLENSGVAPVNAANRGAILCAQLTSQEEIGTRYTLNNGFAIISSAFNIEKPYFAIGANNIFAPVGQQRHTGIELSGAGHLGNDLNIVLGAVLLSPTVKSDLASGFGSSVVPIGQTKYMLQTYADYHFQKYSRITLDAAIVKEGSQFISSTGLRTPAMTTATLGARYHFTFLNKPALLRLQLQNISNVYNWSVGPSGGLSPIQPRNASGYLTVDF